MIPKIIHQIWIGSAAIPPEYLEFSSKWREMYPDFEYILWDDARIMNQNLLSEDKDFIYQSKVYPIAMKADIIRYEIVNQIGGMYIDMDFQPLRKMEDKWFDGKFFGAMQSNREVAIGLFAAIANEPLLTEVNETVVKHIRREFQKLTSLKRIDLLTGPTFFNSVCKKFQGQDGYHFFENESFYPYDHTESHRRHEDFSKSSPLAYAVHHWAHNWFGKS